MSPCSSLYPFNAFTGTAEPYAKFRPPYPKPLLDRLVKEPGVTPDDRLLDLATGPGLLAIPLASYFREIWALDLEPEMVAAGQKEAARLGRRNIRWATGLAESFVAAPGSFGVITIGAAFHRLDQQRITALALEWLRPGGWLVTLGSDSFLTGTEPWHKVVQAEVRRTTQPLAAQPGATLPSGTGQNHDIRILQAAGFVEVHGVRHLEERTWTPESIYGYLRSTSLASDHKLGKHTLAFRDRLFSVLQRLSAEGQFHERLNWGYTAGRKAHAAC